MQCAGRDHNLRREARTQRVFIACSFREPVQLFGRHDDLGDEIALTGAPIDEPVC